MDNYNKIIFEKNGKLSFYKYGIKKEYISLNNINGNILFRTNCFVENGVVLRDIFLWIKKCIKSNEKLFNELFGIYVNELINEGLRINNNIIEDPLDYLIVFPSSQNIKKDGNKIYDYENLIWQFCGKKNKEDDLYAIEFLEPSELAKYKIIIDKNEIFYIYDKKMKIKDSFCIIKYPTLYDFLLAIIWELTWFGSQNNRRKEFNKLKECADECKDENFKGISLDMDDFSNKINNNKKK